MSSRLARYNCLPKDLMETGMGVTLKLIHSCLVEKVSSSIPEQVPNWQKISVVEYDSAFKHIIIIMLLVFWITQIFITNY